VYISDIMNYILISIVKGGRIVVSTGLSGVIVWQLQINYMGQVGGPLTEFCLGLQGGQDRLWCGLYQSDVHESCVH